MKQRSENRKSLSKSASFVVAFLFLVGAISPLVAQPNPLVRAGTKWLSEPLLQFLLRPTTSTVLKDMAAKKVAAFLVQAPISDLPRRLLGPSHGQSFGDGQQWQRDNRRQTPDDLLRIMREVGEEVLKDLLNSPRDTLLSYFDNLLHQLLVARDTSFYRKLPSSFAEAIDKSPREPDSLSPVLDSVVYFATLATVILEVRGEKRQDSAGYTGLADDDLSLAIWCLDMASRFDLHEGIRWLKAGVDARSSGRIRYAAMALCRAEVLIYRAYWVGLHVLAFQKAHASYGNLNAGALREEANLLPVARLMARPTQHLKEQALTIIRKGGPFKRPHRPAPASPDPGRLLPY